MEIEKKYLIKAIPDNLGNFKKKEIEQGYLSRKPTVRIRKSNDDYILTYKGKPPKEEDSDTVICNNEIEAELTEEAYLHLKEKVDGHVITKTRYIIPIEGTKLKIELDVFHGILEGLVFAEVEFDSVEAAEAFIPPEWFGEDVSMDSRYRNGYLSNLASLSDM